MRHGIISKYSIFDSIHNTHTYQLPSPMVMVMVALRTLQHSLPLQLPSTMVPDCPRQELFSIQHPLQELGAIQLPLPMMPAW